MGWLNCAWSLASCTERDFAVWKILLDKGVLAILLLIAGAIGALLLERYKSSLNRHTEFSKIVVPGILDTIALAEDLFNCGLATIEELDQKYRPFAVWLDQLVREPVRIPDDEPYEPPDFRQVKVIEPGGSSTTLGEFVRKMAPNEETGSLVDNAVLWQDPDCGELSNFGAVLASCYRLEPKRRDASHFNVIAPYMFETLPSSARTAYLEKARTFRIRTMRTMEIRTWRQRRIWKKIDKILTDINGVMKRYPVGFLHHYEIVRLPTIEEGLTAQYAAFAVLLRKSIWTL